jgi:hypothetical protein
VHGPRAPTAPNNDCADVISLSSSESEESGNEIDIIEDEPVFDVSSWLGTLVANATRSEPDRAEIVLSSKSQFS